MTALSQLLTMQGFTSFDERPEGDNVSYLALLSYKLIPWASC